MKSAMRAMSIQNSTRSAVVRWECYAQLWLFIAPVPPIYHVKCSCKRHRGNLSDNIIKCQSITTIAIREQKLNVTEIT